MFSKKTIISIAIGSAVTMFGAVPVVSAADSSFAAQSPEKAFMLADAGGGMGMHGHDSIHEYIEKNGKISKEEFMKRQEAMFDKMDTNKDGFIDKAEMEKAMAGKRMKHGQSGTEKPGEPKY